MTDFKNDETIKDEICKKGEILLTEKSLQNEVKKLLGTPTDPILEALRSLDPDPKTYFLQALKHAAVFITDRTNNKKMKETTTVDYAVPLDAQAVITDIRAAFMRGVLSGNSLVSVPQAHRKTRGQTKKVQNVLNVDDWNSEDDPDVLRMPTHAELQQVNPVPAPAASTPSAKNTQGRHNRMAQASDNTTEEQWVQKFANDLDSASAKFKAAVGGRRKTPKVHTGPRGGRYIMKKGKKLYIT
jgi:hypothetical protein